MFSFGNKNLEFCRDIRVIVANNCFLENFSQMSDVVTIISRLFRTIAFVSVSLFFLFL